MKINARCLLGIIAWILNIDQIASAQNPRADFRCTFYSFDPVPLECCIGFEDLSSDIDGSIISQVWDFGDPASGSANTSTGHFLFHCYSAIGQYTLTFSVIDNDGNTDTLRAVNNITVDSLGCSCNWITSVPDLSKSGTEFELFPNPAAGVFTIKVEAEIIKGEISVSDVLGTLVHKENLIGMEQTVPLNVSPGIYIVRLMGSSSQMYRLLVAK